MEHRRTAEKYGKKRPFHIYDNDEQLAMILQTSTGNYQEFGKYHTTIGPLEEALDHLERFPWGNIIIKIDTIKASLL